MDSRLLDGLVCPGCMSSLVFIGEQDEERLYNGELTCTGCGQTFMVKDEVPHLVLPGTKMDGAAWEGGASFRGRIQTCLVTLFFRVWTANRFWMWTTNFRLMVKRLSAPAVRNLVETVRGVEGIVLDIASGPGGSMCIPIMMDDRSDRLLVMSDLGAPVMMEWSRTLRRKGWGDRCSNMIFDARKIPFRDGCVAVITSLLGFNSVLNNRPAYREAERVLAGGGMLIDVVRFHDMSGKNEKSSSLGQVAADRSRYEGFLKDIGLVIERSELLMKGGRGRMGKWEDRVYYAQKPE